MMYHDLMRTWLESGDHAKIAHARYRLTQPDAESDPPPLPLRAASCLYRTRVDCCVGRCWAGLVVARGKLVRREECAACLEIAP